MIDRLSNLGLVLFAQLDLFLFPLLQLFLLTAQVEKPGQDDDTDKHAERAQDLRDDWPLAGFPPIQPAELTGNDIPDFLKICHSASFLSGLLLRGRRSRRILVARPLDTHVDREVKHLLGIFSLAEIC